MLLAAHQMSIYCQYIVFINIYFYGFQPLGRKQPRWAFGGLGSPDAHGVGPCAVGPPPWSPRPKAWCRALEHTNNCLASVERAGADGSVVGVIGGVVFDTDRLGGEGEVQCGPRMCVSE